MIMDVEVQEVHMVAEVQEVHMIMDAVVQEVLDMDVNNLNN